MNTLLLILATVYGIKACTQTNPVTVLPFILEKSRIYLYCKVNETDSLRFLFDTGANGSAINSQAVSRVNLKIDGETMNIGSNGSNRVRKSMDNTILFSTIVKSKVPLVIIHYDTKDFDGVFGTNLMQGFVIAIDYDKLELRFYKTKDFCPEDFKEYEKTRLHVVDGYPCVKTRLIIKGEPYHGLFGLDTGADNALTIASPFVKKNDLSAKMKKIAVSSFKGSDGSEYSMPIMLTPEVSFGRKFFYNVPAALSAATEGVDATHEMQGFFGNDFLKRFNLVIDLDNGYLYSQPGKNLYTPYFN